MGEAAPRKIKAGRWVWSRDYECLVPIDRYLAGKHNYFDEVRSDLPCPAIRPDGMSAVKSMADGRVYDSRSAYYKSVRRAGCEIVGFDRDWERHVRPTYDAKAHEAEIVADIKKAIEIEASKVPSYGPEARRRMRKQKRGRR